MSNLLSDSFVFRKLLQFLTLFSPATIVLTLIIVISTIMYRKKRSRLVNLIQKIPGPPSLPLIGNAIELNVDHDELFVKMTAVHKMFGNCVGIYRIWMGVHPYVLLFNPETVEPILNTSKYIDKSHDYDYLHPWLGTGLLTSFGRKWHSRRKIITPAFHFKILEDFIDVFNEQSAILAQKLEREVDSESFNICPYVTLCALDIVCETAMGRCINAQSNSESEYVKAVYGIGEIIQHRQAKIWLQWDFLFRFTEYFNLHEKYIKILHNFSNNVIRERKKELSNNNNYDNSNTNDADADDIGKKKRLAFLDLLIEASKGGTVLTNEDLREEVDTFMFEGHDTTSAAISWTLLLLGGYPEIQNRAAQELEDIFGNDRDSPPTMADLNNMKYLECCIKDALRLYPSVPVIARSVSDDVQIGKYTVPAGTTALIMPYVLHRNPDTFPKPEQFNPDNFLPENCHGRHPFAYIPFSAGLRNCIGQKFAILEEKAILSAILRKYKIEAVDRREDLTLLGELILRPKNGIKIRITKRA